MSKNKYEQYYQQGRDICGAPFPEFVAFFEDNKHQQARVLDLGCGQGRDALYIARLGHTVIGVDLSPTGIKQMMDAAQKEGLAVEGIVADIVEFEPEGLFGVIIIDRVLHMLADDKSRLSVLANAGNHIHPDGYILIADIPKHQPLLQTFFENKSPEWKIIKQKKGILFARKNK